MKKYFAVMVGVILLATLIDYIEPVEDSEWIDSCYGVMCLDRAEPQPPRNDWGWQNDYCNKIFLNPINKTYGMFIEGCSI